MLRNFSFVIDGELAGSAFPGGWADLPEDLQELSSKGIKVIITLTEETLDVNYLKEFNIENLHIPIQDFTPPTIDQIFQFVEFVEKCRAEKKPVLVHCWAGIGRTGTMLAAYLVYEGYAPSEAIAKIRRLRFGSIETEEQVKIIYEFSKVLETEKGE